MGSCEQGCYQIPHNCRGNPILVCCTTSNQLSSHHLFSALLCRSSGARADYDNSSPSLSRVKIDLSHTLYLSQSTQQRGRGGLELRNAKKLRFDLKAFRFDLSFIIAIYIYLIKPKRQVKRGSLGLHSYKERNCTRVYVFLRCTYLCINWLIICTQLFFLIMKQRSKRRNDEKQIEVSHFILLFSLSPNSNRKKI